MCESRFHTVLVAIVRDGQVYGSFGADNTPTPTFTLSDPDAADTVKFRIQIDDSSDFASAVVDYTSALAAQGATSFTVGQAAGSGSDTTGSAGQTLSDGSYYWRVKTIDDDAAESAYSTANSGAIAFKVDTAAPTTPGTPTTTSPTTSQTPIWTWTASTDGGSGLHGTQAYIVEWSTDSSFAANVSSSTSATASFTHSTSLTDETTWHFRVKAKDAVDNESSVSTSSSFAVDTTPPPGPSASSAHSGTGLDFRYVQLPPPSAKPDFKEEEVGLQPEPPGVIERILEPFIPGFLKPKPEEPQEVPVEELIPKETPLVFRGIWELLPEEPIREFALAPLPREIRRLAEKFPELAKTFEQVGIRKITDLQKLQAVTLTLPGLAERVGTPSEIVFAKTGGGLIDFDIALTLNSEGEPIQTISTIAGKPLFLSVKPDKEVERVTGYITFKEQLALLKFEYLDPDGDGIFTQEIEAPVVDGEYEILTVMDYEAPELGSREIRLAAIIDPEGYVYEKSGDKETRVPGAIVSLYSLNPETKQYELWTAKEYEQKNPQVTDVKGTYSFLVPKGYYYLTIEAPGYPVYQGKAFEVAEGSGIHENIELKTKLWWIRLLDWKTVALIFVSLLLLVNFYRDRIRKRSQ